MLARPGSRCWLLNLPELDVEDDPPLVADDPNPATDDRPTKTCPDCAETILAAARVCRYCGYRFERVG